MAKKKPVNKKDGEIKAAEPEFKPGDTPHLEYDGSVLNANVPWNEVILELQQQGCAASDIADYAECAESVIKELVNKNYSNLNFRTGARIITYHCKHNPSVY